VRKASRLGLVDGLRMDGLPADGGRGRPDAGTGAHARSA
jgi:hypothetical protein